MKACRLVGDWDVRRSFSSKEEEERWLRRRRRTPGVNTVRSFSPARSVWTACSTSVGRGVWMVLTEERFDEILVELTNGETVTMKDYLDRVVDPYRVLIQQLKEEK